jgi:hypothetical protein
LIYVGIALLVVTAILFFVRRGQIGSLRQVMGTETSTVEELSRLSTGVAEEIGEAGRFLQYSEVKGIARCDSPLSAEISGQNVVHYKTLVSQEYEETYYERDSQTGREERRTRRNSETVASSERSAEFWVEDATGRIRVIPAGASFDTLTSVDRFEPGPPSSGASVSLGGIQINLGGALATSNRQVLGLRYHEDVIPVDARVYVIGEATTRSGELAIQMPTGKDQRFMISVRTEEEIVRSARNAVTWLTYGSIATGCLGVVLVVLGIIR